MYVCMIVQSIRVEGKDVLCQLRKLLLCPVSCALYLHVDRDKISVSWLHALCEVSQDRLGRIRIVVLIGAMY